MLKMSSLSLLDLEEGDISLPKSFRREHMNRWKRGKGGKYEEKKQEER
jgi:hypothetical protein